MFDNVCRFLAESFSADFATWLLGRKESTFNFSKKSQFIPQTYNALFVCISEFKSEIYELIKLIEKTSLFGKRGF
jgi:predicted transposase YdaD